MKESANTAVELNVEALDLDSLESLKGSALETILREIKEDETAQVVARHSSHSSYSTHGTAAW